MRREGSGGFVMGVFGGVKSHAANKQFGASVFVSSWGLLWGIPGGSLSLIRYSQATGKEKCESTVRIPRVLAIAQSA